MKMKEPNVIKYLSYKSVVWCYLSRIKSHVNFGYKSSYLKTISRYQKFKKIYDYEWAECDEKFKI